MDFKITKVTGDESFPDGIPNGGETSNPTPNFWGTALESRQDINIYYRSAVPPDEFVGGTRSNSDGSWMAPIHVKSAGTYVFYARVGRNGPQSNEWTVTILHSAKLSPARSDEQN